MAAFPQQQGAENANDAQVEEEAEQERPHRPREGRQAPVGHQRRFAGHHVGYDGLHLEVCPHHGADVEELVAVACHTKSLCVGNVQQPADNCAQARGGALILSALTTAATSPKICLSAAEKTENSVALAKQQTPTIFACRFRSYYITIRRPAVLPLHV